jgi:hypothetical protein
MRQIIRTSVTFAAVAIGAITLAASPAAASYQGDKTGPAVIIQIDCLTILSRVSDLNEMVEALNEQGNEAWNSWQNGDTSNDEIRDTIRDFESAANQVGEAYDQALVAWGAKGCKGTLPPLDSFDFPWRELGLGG